MPINFINNKPYDIDYSKLYEYCFSFPIFNDPGLKEKYITKWIEILKEFDSKSNKDRNNYGLEMFQCPIQLGDSTILIHFNIDQIRKTIEKRNIKTFDPYDIKNFYDSGRIYWTRTKEGINYDQPVYIVPFLFGNYDYLVVDGNHRITYAVDNDKNYVNGIIIDDQTLIIENCFASEFDRLFYIFFNEFARILNNHLKLEYM